ncbi:MAG: Uma2 family endonuclease [Planctomycetes bacterium]|nr:Uma2 family endonuclease [Planctomycetota bacterium]
MATDTATTSAAFDATARPRPPADRDAVRPLVTGDRLTRAEFERRYAAMPHVKKAELIEGVVYMSTAVSFEDHGAPHAELVAWLGMYEAYTAGVGLGDNCTVRLDLDNEPQPDALLLILPDQGGQAKIIDGFIEGAPELAAEVTASTASYDLHDKLTAYRRNGVLEYIVWRVWDEAIDWFLLQEGCYDRLEPAEDGILRSRVFPGLWLDAQALSRGDMPRVLDVLHNGMKDATHAEFVQHLREHRERQ